MSNPGGFFGSPPEDDRDELVTRSELYLVTRELQKLILAVRLEAAAMRIGGPSIVEANEEFTRAEAKLDDLLNSLVRRGPFG